MAATVMNSADSTGDGCMVTLGAVAARIRRYLQDTPRESLPITYQALARVLGLSPPNMIHQVTESLEHLMREDAAAGRPFIAAFERAVACRRGASSSARRSLGGTTVARQGPRPVRFTQGSLLPR